jgi:hypothetical protein
LQKRPPALTDEPHDGQSRSDRLVVRHGLSSVAGTLNEPSGFGALFAQITFPKEYEVMLEPALK